MDKVNVLRINRNSWHFRFWRWYLVTICNSKEKVKNGPYDSCDYYGDLMIGIFYTLLFLGIGGGLLYSTVWFWPYSILVWLCLAVVVFIVWMFLRVFGDPIEDSWFGAKRYICRPVEIFDSKTMVAEQQ